MWNGSEKSKDMPELIRIAITGPESTGKSWLAENLAKHFNTNWVPEFARNYIARIGKTYTLSDIVYIAENQISSEKQLSKLSNRLIFIDTEMLVCKIWSEVKFGMCPEYIAESLARQNYDLYLLCNIDLPWADDPLREHPHFRIELFNMYLKEIKQKALNYRIISGFGHDRLKNAINIIEEFHSIL